jgi:hypothetical protein
MAYRHFAQTEFAPRLAAETKILDGKPVRFRDVCVHEIKMEEEGFMQDICVAAPIWEWQQTDAGRFVMEHAVSTPYWIQHRDHSSYYLLYRIMARLSEQNEVFWRLKYVSTND